MNTYPCRFKIHRHIHGWGILLNSSLYPFRMCPKVLKECRKALVQMETPFSRDIGDCVNTFNLVCSIARSWTWCSLCRRSIGTSSYGHGKNCSQFAHMHWLAWSQKETTTPWSAQVCKPRKVHPAPWSLAERPVLLRIPNFQCLASTLHSIWSVVLQEIWECRELKPGAVCAGGPLELPTIATVEIGHSLPTRRNTWRPVLRILNSNIYQEHCDVHLRVIRVMHLKIGFESWYKATSRYLLTHISTLWNSF